MCVCVCVCVYVCVCVSQSEEKSARRMASTTSDTGYTSSVQQQGLERKKIRQELTLEARFISRSLP